MATQLGAGHLPIVLAAQAVTGVIRQINANLPFALCGEVAYTIYSGLGYGAAPELEVMILSPTTDVDQLKRAIVQAAPDHFFFSQSNNTLYFRNSGGRTLPHGSQLRIPLDIIVSHKSHPHARVCNVGGFPLVPYSFLILQKLEKWDLSLQQGVQGQLRWGSPSVIAKEIRAMLKLLRVRDLHDGNERPLFDADLHYLSKERVARFFALHGSFGKEWRKIGFYDTKKQTDTPVAGQKQKTKTNKKSLPTVSGTLFAGTSSVTAPNEKAIVASTRFGISEVEPVHPSNIPAVAPPPTTMTTEAGTAAASNRPLAAVEEPKAAKEPRMSFMRLRYAAAQSAVKVLHELGFSCAIFGSFACKLYGNSRIPNDVDILVLPPPESTHTQEDIKEAMVSADQHFFLEAARDPSATYRVLYFSLSASTPNTKARGKTSKVDILLPGVMHLPALPIYHLAWKNELPIVPFSVLVLQKLQGWDDHRKAVEARYTKKAPVDAKDLTWLLGRNLSMLRRWPWNLNNRTLFSEEFERLSRERVISFCAAFPQHVNVFRSLGFSTA